MSIRCTPPDPPPELPSKKIGNKRLGEFSFNLGIVMGHLMNPETIRFLETKMTKKELKDSTREIFDFADKAIYQGDEYGGS